jgi:hypothetical protein
MTLAFRLATEFGAIEVRREPVYPRVRFWWFWADLELDMGPFRTLAEALADAVDSLNTVRDSIRQRAALAPSTPPRA